MHRITFDSNVWRKVASPARFPKDPDLESFRKLGAACRSGEIIGFISETTLTLEQIKKEDRLAWLQSSSQISVEEVDAGANGLQLRFVIGAECRVVPVMSQIVQRHLDDAYEIGIRVLRSKRVGGPNSRLLRDPKYFLDYESDAEYHQHNNRSGEVARVLESLGMGIANIKSKGMSDANGKHWLDGLKSLPDSEKKRVAELVAEWADADAVACSIAHEVAYFCTDDIGKGSSNKGILSVMSPVQSQAVSDRFGIRFVSPTTLVQELGF